MTNASLPVRNSELCFTGYTFIGDGLAGCDDALGGVNGVRGASAGISGGTYGIYDSRGAVSGDGVPCKKDGRVALIVATLPKSRWDMLRMRFAVEEFTSEGLGRS